MADEVVSKEMVDKLHKALNPQPAAPAPAAPAAAIAPSAPATPGDAPAAPAAGEQPRGADGKFAPKEMSPAEKGLLAAARAERDRRKAAEARIAELEKRAAQPIPTQPQDRDPLPDLLGRMPPETQEWWKKSGQEAIDALIERRIAERDRQIEPDLADIRASRAERAAMNQFHADLTEFAEDMALEGSPVDPEALVNTIRRFETEHDISLGSTNRKKFENAIGLMGTQRGKPAGESPEEAKARADREAADRARGGGASPGSSPASAPPPATGEALGKQVRAAAYRGDDREIAKIIASRLPKRPAWSQ